MRYLLTIALIFAFTGVVNADGIPTAVDAKNQPSVWTQTVYANAAITSGYVVEWDFDTCDTTGYVDMCPWVKLCNGEDDIWTAGVVPIDNDVSAGSTFDMIIRGPAFVKEVSGASVTAGAIVGSTASGTVENEGGSGDSAHLGIAIQNTAAATRPALGANVSIIFVNPGYDAY